MNRLLLILILTLSFHTLVKADDIGDFEIEGMSIGDSLLSFFSEKEISNAPRYDNTNTVWKSDEMFQLRTSKNGPYTEIMFALKKNDKKYIIYGISGLLKMEFNISECYPKLDNVANEFDQLFPNARILEQNEPHEGDISGKSMVKSIYYIFPSGDHASAECYDWSNEMDYWDNFRISVITKEFDNWITSNF